MRFHKLLFLLLLLAPLAKAAPTVTVTATSTTLLGTSQTISMTCQLIDPNQTGILRTGGTVVTNFSTSTATPGTTATCGPLWGNDVVTDGFGNASTSYYLISVSTVSGGIIASTPAVLQAYQFAGSGTFDLASTLPFSLGPVSPAGSVLGQNLTFTGTDTATGPWTFGSLTVTGPFSSTGTSNINNFLFLGSTTYPMTDVGLLAAIAALGGAGTVIIPPGTVALSSPITTLTNRQHILCAGIDATKLNYIGGATTAIFDIGTAADGTSNRVNISINRCTISGNANVQYAIRARGVQHSDFSHNSLINVTIAGIQTLFGIKNQLDDLHTSLNDQAFSVQPLNCIILDGPDANHKTTTTSIYQPACEGVSGTGIVLIQSADNVILGGTSEQNNRNLTLATTAVGNTIQNLDTETGAVSNVEDGGIQNNFINLTGNGLVHVLATAKFSHWTGSFYDSMTVDNGALDTLFLGVGYNNSGAGSLTDNSSSLTKFRVANLASGIYDADTLTGTNGLIDSASVRGTQVMADIGSACTNGELALSAGWQSTGAATVTAVAGKSQTCSWTITTGTTTAANPTITDTLVVPLPTATIVCEMNIHGGTHAGVAGEGFTQTTLSATAPVFTFVGTPGTTGVTYFVTRRCGP